MKLYRGLKSGDYKELDVSLSSNYYEDWEKVLIEREKGNYKYPEHINPEIIELHKLEKLELQHFTDKKDVALKYAKTDNGVLIEINPPIRDILENFMLEIQNYAKRKEIFEVVYVIKGSDLAKNKDKWAFRLIRF